MADQSQTANVTDLPVPATGGNSVVGSIVGENSDGGDVSRGAGHGAGGGVGRRRSAAQQKFAKRGGSGGGIVVLRWYVFMPACFGQLEYRVQRKNVQLRDGFESFVYRRDNGKSWLIVDSIRQIGNLQFEYGDCSEDSHLTGSNSIVRNLSLHDSHRHPLTVYIGAANNLVTNVTAYHAYGTSPLAIYGPGTTGNLVQNSTFYKPTLRFRRRTFRPACGPWSWRMAARPTTRWTAA